MARFFDKEAFGAIKDKFNQGYQFSELNEEEKSSIIAYVGACEIIGKFIHPSELLISGSELTSPIDTFHLIMAIWKLGYTPMIAH